MSAKELTKLNHALAGLLRAGYQNQCSWLNSGPAVIIRIAPQENLGPNSLAIDSVPETYTMDDAPVFKAGYVLTDAYQGISIRVDSISADQAVVVVAIDDVAQPPNTPKGDWTFCGNNAQCQSSCCSQALSDDSRYKCHPVNRVNSIFCNGDVANPGCPPGSCLGPNGWCGVENCRSLYRTGLLDWQFCGSNQNCANSCCSREKSDDGKYKCTPNGTVCVGDPTSPIACPRGQCVGPYRWCGDYCNSQFRVQLPEWSFCGSNNNCANSCCSREKSVSDGKFKCTPNGAACVGDPSNPIACPPGQSVGPYGWCQ
jgi:hypothetical protein